MGTVTKANTFVAGTDALAAQVNENFDDIYNEFNGSIENVNIGASAAIADTKLATISTAGKVLGSALNTFSGIPSGAGLIPSANQDTVTTLVDAATIATDASASTVFEVTLGGNRTLGNPTNSVAGMKRVWVIRQDGTGARTLAFDTDFRFAQEILQGGFGGSLVISTQASSINYIGAIYNGVDAKWDILGLSTRVA